ncbi:MAG: PAS domain-containing protein [Microcella sp.]|uniref:sensor histidine kinase n=1 Tax=Microcella sp. TaxID=1913979 RepID=UPI0024C74B1E|nr:ATP-binding protein [Microcella sp.]UYN83230.1 MAG: PAS domain-containing protein [Microcella sp.]
MSLASGAVTADAGSLSLLAFFPVAMVLTALLAYALVDEAASASTAESTVRQLRDAIVETVDAGIVVLNSDSEVLLVNRTIREHPVVAGAGSVDTSTLRSIQAYEADGVTPYPPGDGPIARALANHYHVEELFWVHQADGTPHAFRASSSRLRNARGAVEATVVALSDVTELVDAVRVRDRLISTVSHELRTPLTAMKGFLELARDEITDDESLLAHYLAIVDRNLEREQAVIEHFILAANSFTSRLHVHEIDLDLTALATSIVSESALVALRGDVTVRVVGGPVQCRADLSLCTRVIGALLSNALSAVAANGQVTISTSALGSDRVRLEVADNGSGIAEVDTAQLFTRFFRTDRSDDEAVPGVGLGLPLVKQIVDAHGGTVSITSELGVGTTVTIEMPIQRIAR